MKISFHGACREVTGSCTLVETKKTKFLVDCGMFQGEDFVSSRNFDEFDFKASEIDFVLLTHAHIDHCGRLPKLFKDGFRGKIYCTAATRDLTVLMLTDSAKIISSEALSHGMEPFYSEDDVFFVSKLFKELPYNEEIVIAGDVKIKLGNSGHVLGSSFFEVWIKENKKEKKLVFSGDLGNSPARIIRDLDFVAGADLVFIESTYAGQEHESREEGIKQIRKAVIECIKNKGTLMIPIFALEKVQEILYELNSLVENKKIPYVPMFLDSPLAIKATEIYKNYEYLYDKESTELIVSGDDLFDFPGLEFTLSSQQSKTINNLRPPKVVLAGGGMCMGGRIQYHLKFNLDDPNSHVLLVAYQVKGSLGRKLMTGHKTVVIDNATVPVRAKVSTINSYSAHADHGALLSWLKRIKNPKPQHVFVVHGEEESNVKFRDDASKKIKTNFIIPEYGQAYEF
ncbi:MAG TPA: MBL fold metallo-hydrolase [bacterium]|nr:MBL fold metallo-hydrolase [bacterium]HPV65410.1 MBL fold metallo-hydrolase [bacterium]